ncbi:MAG: NAD-dependent epimerase/dehydratase family protein [Nitrosopumilaceae archaeon]|nr:NAD-dependent epimerase/dehydratase family protein [Nitrosopumilaceae archaeon]NIP09365.1 NAD-dependent epimerase/dehydratase family protein [Nitrosopumilaceae archaeon]NIS94595.1 NAD-dependent epimerase/dehydratase family protein [Nitrosopumilaceae archaeon]
MAKSVFVTGATGFVGSRLVENLIDKEYEVTSLIRRGKQSHPKSDSVIGDLTDSKLEIPIENVECVFHLASHTPLEKNKKILEKVNLEGTKNLFEQIKDKTKSLIYISGLGVYGDPGDKIVDENFPYNPDTNFVKIRLEAQKFLEKNCNDLGINFSVVHFGDVYGPRGWFYEFLIKRLLKNTFRLPKNGDYYKGFVHVDDAAGSLISVLEQKTNNESYIVADSTPAKFRDFVDFTAEQIGAKRAGSVPVFLAKTVLGGDLIKLLTTSMKVSNKKISQIYDFKFPSYKEGIPNVISELKSKGLLN